MNDPTIRHVAAAVLARRSVRAYTAQQVPDEALETILAVALRAPSGGNLQPWQIHVMRSAALEGLRARMRLKQASGQVEAPNHQVYPENLWEPYRSRRYANGEELYSTIGIDRTDRPGRQAQLAQNFQLFGAPVGLFFVIDRRMGAAQWIDLGMVMQTVMLIAVELGLATCPQAAWALWPDTLRDLLKLDGTMVVAAGMALGYEDRAHPINTLRTERQTLAEGVRWHD